MIKKRFTIIYNENAKMMQYVDNQKEEPNRWAIWNVSETAQKLNNLSDENEQLKQKVNFYKYFQKDARELEKENEKLRQLLLQFYTEDEINAEMI